MARIKEAIARYEITATDLGLTESARKARGAGGKKTEKAKKTAGPAVGRVKYEDGAGNAWSGFGRKPRWFVDVLASGKTEAELRASLPAST